MNSLLWDWLALWSYHRRVSCGNSPAKWGTPPWGPVKEMISDCSYVHPLRSGWIPPCPPLTCGFLTADLDYLLLAGLAAIVSHCAGVLHLLIRLPLCSHIYIIRSWFYHGRGLTLSQPPRCSCGLSCISPSTAHEGGAAGWPLLSRALPLLFPIQLGHIP